MDAEKIFNGRDDVCYSFLFSHGVDISQYKYNTDNPEKTPLARKDKIPLQIPELWMETVTKGALRAITYLIQETNYLTVEIAAAIISAEDTYNIIGKSLLKKLIAKLLRLFPDQSRINIDTLGQAAINSDKFEYLKTICDFANIKHIEPLFGNYGNIGNGMGLSSAAKTGNLDMVKYLIELGADPNKDDQWCIANAMKHHSFTIVEYLLEHGGSLEVRPNLLKKLIDKAEHEIVFNTEKEAWARIKNKINSI